MVERGDGKGLYQLFIEPSLEDFIGSTTFETTSPEDRLMNH